MKKILILAIIVSGCVTLQNPKQTRKTKYQVGDCVSFNPARVKGRVDGTLMLILGITKRSYLVEINHHMVSGPVHFTANKKVFEWETKKTPCQ